MPAAAAAVVVFTGVTSATAVAVVTAATYGVIAGAVIGAATAVIKGGDLGDVLKGALVGAAVGGVVGGTIGYVGALSAPAATAAATTTAAAPSATVAATPTAVSAAAPTATLPGMANVAVNVPAAASAVAPATEMSMGKALLYGNTLQGLSSGVGSYGAAKTEAESAEALANKQAEIDEAKIAANAPGQFTAQVANVSAGTESDWWDKHLADIKKYERPLTGYNTGLLGGTA